MVRRSYLSVVRKKSKSIIMLLFLFIVSTLVLCSISIKNATNKSMDLAKQSLGGEVTLSADMSKLREEFMPQGMNQNGMPNTEENTSDTVDRKQQMQNMHEKMNESNATIDDVKKISSIKYVDDVKYTFSVNATESSFSLYSSDSSESSIDNGIGHKMEKYNNILQVEAINAFELQDDYVGGKIELVSGDVFDETDEDVAIISYELGVENNLSVGDTITLKDSDNDEHVLTIIGIYQQKDANNFANYNKIYIDINSAEKFLSEEEYNNGNYNISSAVFYLNDPEKVEEFKTEANELVTDLEDRYLTLDIDTAAYEKMVSSIEGVSTFSNVILVVVIVSAIVIISLIVINSLKDRNYEIGVLLSLGEKKTKIIGQFIIELLLIAFISFILSIGTSMLISQKLANIILESQVTNNQVDNGFSNNQRGNGFKGNMGIMQNNQNVDVIDEIDVNVTTKDISILFIIELGIIIISMGLPSIKILNSDPKDILSRKE